MPLLLYFGAGFGLALAILANPFTLYFLQRRLSIGVWKDECPTCGSVRLCYPTEKNGLQAGRTTTLIATECKKCGDSFDPNYAGHRPT